MKKLILLFALMISSLNYAQNFPENDIQLLENKELKVLEKDVTLQKYGFEGFYTDEALKKKFDLNNSYNSKYESLVGKVFKVISYEPYKNLIGKDKFKLKIENAETGILYFDYDPRFEHSFPFEVIGGLTLPADFYCKKIKIETDKFTGETKSNTDYSEGISILKVEKDKTITIYLSINTTGSTLNVGKEGLILLLENNKRIEKPEARIDAKVNTSGKGYVYNAFVRLTPEDIKLLKENNITDARLYIYDSIIKKGFKIKEYLKCLSK